ncbi:MAG: flagellar motor protein MotA [Gammaproteobacteria bacterium]|nr:MAG: flagellar motor protein MotA [Gammaproteobacteria bacterium]
MNPKFISLLGIAICLLLFVVGIFIGHGQTLLLNLESWLIVIAGTLAAAFLSYPYNSLWVSLRVAINSYVSQTPTAREIVSSLLQLSMLSKMDGLLALEEGGERASVLFLKRALSILVDGFSVDELRDVLYTEISFFQQRRAIQARVFRHMAILAPAFGLIGSIVNVATQTSVGHTGFVFDAIVLAPILYGIIFSAFVFLPVSENIHAKTQEELLIHKLIAEGVILIAQEYNTVRLQTRLQSFITPYERDAQHLSVKEIRDRYEEFKNSRQES